MQHCFFPQQIEQQALRLRRQPARRALLRLPCRARAPPKIQTGCSLAWAGRAATPGPPLALELPTSRQLRALAKPLDRRLSRSVPLGQTGRHRTPSGQRPQPTVALRRRGPGLAAGAGARARSCVIASRQRAGSRLRGLGPVQDSAAPTSPHCPSSDSRQGDAAAPLPRQHDHVSWHRPARFHAPIVDGLHVATR